MNLGARIRNVLPKALQIANSSPMVLQATTSVWDPVQVRYISTSTNYSFLGAEENYDARYMRGQDVQEGDVWVTIAAKELPIIPKPGMNLFLGPEADENAAWGEVKGVRKHRLNGVMVAYTLHVRGAA